MKVLAGLLHSPEGDAAIKHAAAEAHHHQGELILVVFVRTPHEAHETQSYSADRAAAAAAAEQEAAQLRTESLPVSVEVPVGVHTPAEAILRAADERDVDLIVIGMRKRSRVGKIILGSNAQDILLGAHAPVLAVKPSGEA